jgi:hypothetical protein
MPDTERLRQEVALAAAIAAALPPLAPPARKILAHNLFDQGVRLHPEFATKQAVADGPDRQANWRPQQLLEMAKDPFEIVKNFTPELAEKIAAAQTEEQRAAIREEIRHKHGSQIADLAAKIEQNEESLK